MVRPRHLALHAHSRNIATVVVFLFWIYVSAVILLWGVEFTASYTKMRRDIRAAGAEAHG